MNIFRLSECPKEAAIFYNDIHVKKIIVEIAQMLANCYSLEELQNAPKTQTGSHRKHSYYNHPLSKWIRSTFQNWDWTVKHGLALCDEFKYRTCDNKEHFCFSFINWVANNSLKNIPYTNLTEQPQCFKHYPHLITPGNPVEGYRKYYNADKLSYKMRDKIIRSTWTKREIPFFIDKKLLNAH